MYKKHQKNYSDLHLFHYNQISSFDLKAFKLLLYSVISKRTSFHWLIVLSFSRLL